MADIAVILLAAGFSHRMGGVNKLLLPIDGIALLRRTAEMLASLPNANVTVVLGHDSQKTVGVLAGLNVTQTINPDYAKGLSSSVFHGLSSAGLAESYMITPADMPRLMSADCLALIKAHKSTPDGTVTVPVRPGPNGPQRGNPIILSGAARAEVIAGDINLGCRELLQRRPELIHEYTTNSNGFFIDIDTPQDYSDETGQRPKDLSFEMI